MRRLWANLILVVVAPIPIAWARDPGDVQTRAREPSRDRGFVPERIDTSKLHGPRQQQPRERRRLYEQVEDDVDRGKGRVEDRQTYDARRMQDDRDERLSRIKPRRETERLLEEEDRRQRIDAIERKSRPAIRETPGKGIVVAERPPTPGGSTLARFVEEQSQLLANARERYQQDLKDAEKQRDEAIRAAGDSARERSLANRQFAQRRSELTREYQEYRRTILGR